MLIPATQIKSRRLFGLLLGVVFTASGCSRPSAPAAPASQTVGGLTITLSASPAAHTGDNTFVVTLRDAANQAPVGNANVSAAPEMLSPRLPGTNTSGRAQGNGTYTVPIRLGVATRYDVALHVERPGHPAADASFPVEAAQ